MFLFLAGADNNVQNIDIHKKSDEDNFGIIFLIFLIIIIIVLLNLIKSKIISNIFFFISLFLFVLFLLITIIFLLMVIFIEVFQTGEGFVRLFQKEENEQILKLN